VDQLALKSGVPSGERRAARMWLQAARLGLPQCWWMGCMRERTETATFCNHLSRIGGARLHRTAQPNEAKG